MDNEMNLKIKKAFSDVTPDIFNSILTQCNEQKGSAVIMTTNKRNNFKKFVSIAAALVLVIAGLGVFGVYKTNNTVKSVVSLDVNPSIELKLNKNEKVLDVLALNEDAQNIVGTMDFKGSDLTVTINALVGSMLRNGYLSDIQNSILVTVDGDDHTKNEEIQKKLVEEINAILGGNNLEGAVVTQENAHVDENTALAEKFGISEGKAQLANELANELAGHTADELAELTINELNILAEKTDTVTSSGTASKKAYIGEDKALEIALEKAGVTPEDAKEIEIDIDSDYGVMVYEIEFTAPPYEYDVEVNAENGEIVRFEKDGEGDYDDIEIEEPTVAPEAPDTTVAPATPDTTKAPDAPVKNDTPDEPRTEPTTVVQTTAPVRTTAAAVTYITQAKAKTIALAKAGVAENELVRYNCEFDYDDGTGYYDVSFKTDTYEYDVEINAVTGNITDYDKELLDDDRFDDDRYDDDDDDDDDYRRPATTEPTTAKPATTKPTTTKPAATKPETTKPSATKAPANELISKDEAKSVALTHAGLNADDVKNYHCELDFDDGKNVYEIEFDHGKFEYSYEIDAATGKIIDSERDTDD